MVACKSTPTELVERRNLERPKATTRKNAEGLKLGRVTSKPSLTLMSSWIFNPGENKRPGNSMGGGEDKDTPWKRMGVEAHAGSTPRGRREEATCQLDTPEQTGEGHRAGAQVDNSN